MLAALEVVRLALGRLVQRKFLLLLLEFSLHLFIRLFVSLFLELLMHLHLLVYQIVQWLANLERSPRGFRFEIAVGAWLNNVKLLFKLLNSVFLVLGSIFHCLPLFIEFIFTYRGLILNTKVFVMEVFISLLLHLNFSFRLFDFFSILFHQGFLLLLKICKLALSLLNVL